MSKKYNNPPIVEALCEFRFTPDTFWDMTVPGLVYEKLKELYPHRSRQILQQIEVDRTGDSIEQKVTQKELARFMSDDKKSFVQVGQNLLSIHSLPPYPSWKVFFPAIEKTFTALSQIVSPISFERIGLRYINRIHIVSPTVVLSDYFIYRPEPPRNISKPLDSFLLGSVFKVDGGKNQCRIQLATDNSAADASSYILDIDFSSVEKNAASPEGAIAWVSHAHTELESIFENCITDAARNIFGVTSDD